MGNTCKSMADSCQCMTKTTTIKKKMKLMEILCQAAAVINSVSKFNFPSNIL